MGSPLGHRWDVVIWITKLGDFVDGWNPVNSPVEGKVVEIPLFIGFQHHPRWWSPDFRHQQFDTPEVGWYFITLAVCFPLGLFWNGWPKRYGVRGLKVTKFQKPEKYPIRWMVFFLPYEMEVKNKHIYILFWRRLRGFPRNIMYTFLQNHIALLDSTVESVRAETASRTSSCCGGWCISCSQPSWTWFLQIKSSRWKRLKKQHWIHHWNGPYICSCEMVGEDSRATDIRI